MTRWRAGILAWSLLGAAPAVQAALVGHWHADDWAGGTNLWVDRVGAWPAAPAGDPLPSYGAFQGARGILFDSDDRFDVTSTNNPAAGKTHFTLIALFKTGTPGVNNNVQYWFNAAVVGGEAPGTPNDWGLCLLQRGTARGYFGGAYVDTGAEGYVVDGRAHTLALTWADPTDGGDGSLRFYVDGVLRGETGAQDGGAGISATGFAIGANQYQGTACFVGAIGEVRMYDSVEDVAALHGALTAPAPGPRLIARWVADDWPGTGAWLDRVGGRAAVPAGDPAVTNGAIGTSAVTNGIAFDGDDRFDVTLANNPAAGKARLTLIASFRTTTPGLNDNANFWENSAVVGGESGGAPNDWGLCVLANGSARGYFNDYAPTAGSVVDGRLHTLALTWSDPTSGGDSVLRFYVDGLCKGTAGTTDGGSGIVSNGFAMAANFLGGTGYFTGTLGEIRMYDAIENVPALHAELAPGGDPLLLRWVADDWSGAGDWRDRMRGWPAVPSGDPSVSNRALRALAVTNGVFFDGDDRFDVAGSHPAAGATRFTAIVSFRTRSPGVNLDPFYSNSALVGGEAAAAPNDFGLCLQSDGNARAYLSAVAVAGGNVADGRLHSLAMTWSDPHYGGDAMIRLYVDGVLRATHHGHTPTGYNDGGDGIVNNGFAIGANQLGGTFYYTGAIGEVRMYGDLMDVGRLHREMAAGGLVGQWVANDWRGAGSNWVDRVQGRVARASGDPASIAGGMSNRDAVEFDGDDRFDVAAADNPAAGRLQCTVAVSFRTATPGANNNANHWENSALVGGEAPGTERNDWGLCLLQGGTARAYFGNVSLADTLGLVDGLRHTLALTWSDLSARGDARMRLYVDGVVRGTNAVADWLDGADAAGFAIGANQILGTAYYTGLVGEVRIYDTVANVAKVHAELLTARDAVSGTLLLVR